MDKFDFKKKKATPEWLTSILKKNGFLVKGSVFSVEQEPTLANSSFISDFISLKVNYSQDSLGHVPSKFLMKMIKPKYYTEKEVDFYNALSNAKTSFPTLTCYGTEKSPKTQQGYILLDDLTHTHHTISSSLPPSQDQCKEAITVLAKMHAYWWNHSRFGEKNFETPSEKGWREHIHWHEKLYTQFVDFLGDRLTENRKRIYSLIFEKLPELLWNRVSSPRNLSLVHGDAHFKNFLYPHNGYEDQCIIFDWQSWYVGLGATDLSYNLALFCDPEHRKRIEQYLLKIYFDELQKRQIAYLWEELQNDYRISFMFNLLLPIWWYSINDQYVWWWPHLERGFTAFEDLDCMEFV